MSRLEFELLGRSYARGYEAALCGFRNEPVNVLVQLHRGHLYSAIDQVSAERSAHCEAARPLDPTVEQWVDRTKPVVQAHLREFARLAGKPPDVALHDAARLFEHSVTMHHQLLLPARQTVSQFLKTASQFGIAEQESTELPFAALALLGVDLPAFRGAQSLLGAAAFGDDDLVDLLGDVAPDGDGYGLALAGWLDSAGYAHVMRALLHRAAITDETLAKRIRLRMRRRHLAEATLLSVCPPSRRSAFARLLSKARVAMEITECHGPLMHASYLHHLRLLVHAHGGLFSPRRKSATR